MGGRAYGEWEGREDGLYVTKNDTKKQGDTNGRLRMAMMFTYTQ